MKILKLKNYIIIGMLMLFASLFMNVNVKADLELGSSVTCSENSDWEYREYYNYGEETNWEESYTGDIAVSGYSGSNMQVTVPATLDGKRIVRIDNDAFYSNENIKSIDLSQVIALEEIGSYAFGNCEALQTVNWNAASIKKIQENAFYGSKSLKNVTIPTNSNYNKIENGTFEGCKLLSSITTLPSNVQNIGEQAFQNTGMTEFTIPDTVITVGKYAFSDCEKLKTIKLSNNSLFTTIPDGMLKDCKMLSKLDIPQNIDTIGYEAFCRMGVTSIIISESVQTIENDVFWGCGDVNLKYIQFKGSTPPTFGENVFYQCENVTVIVPTGTTSAYKAEMVNAGMSSTSTYMESGIDITVIPVLSEAYNEKMIVTGKLYEGQPVNQIGIKASFRDSATNTLVSGTLTWQEGDKKYEAGGHYIGWVFTPSSANALKVTGTFYVDVKKIPGKVSDLKVSAMAKNSIKTLWSSVYEADGYEVWMQQGSGSWSCIATINKLNYNVAKLTAGSNYKFKVRAYGISGSSTKVYGDFSSEIKAATKPDAPKLSSVKKKGKKITAKWKKGIKGADGYQILISTKKTKGFKAKATIKKASSKKGQVKKPSKKGTYYVRVRAYKLINGKKIYSSHSNTKKIKV